MVQTEKMRHLASLSALIPVLTWAISSVGLAQVDLGKVYGGKLDFGEGVGAVNCTALPEDVWKLSEFDFKLRGKLELEFGPSTLVIGKNVDEEDKKSAVWAAIFPEEPTPIVSSEPGHGDHARAVFIRLNPGILKDLFPKKTVEGPGEARWLVEGKRQFGHKIGSSWQWDNMPVVPWKKSIVFDVDTVEGDRRFYMVDTKAKTVKYEGAFAGRAVSYRDGAPLKEGEGLETYRSVWEAFDAEYPMFGVKEGLDWDGAFERYKPLAEEASSVDELAGVIALLVSELEDLHVWVRRGDQWIPTYNRFRVTNANWEVIKGQLVGLKEPAGLAYGRTAGTFGYINVWNLQAEGLSDAFDEALEELGDTTGLIIDLRYNGGGDENLGRRVAGRFLGKKAVYSKNQYRDGPRHGDLGKVLSRECEPRGPWRYEAPVVVLQGQKTMSSAESLALMLAQAENVTTIGDRTAGSSANPRRLELSHGIVVNMPRWLDQDPKGKPIDGVGVPPDIEVDAKTPGEFKTADPVFESAVKELKGQRNKKPGKR